jgi:hypothetical protein
MRKILNFILIILTSILIAGVYGIVHDQITYSISAEYYTLFKFEQFGINEWGISDVRTKAGIIGFLATWWVGLFLGIIYAIISLFLTSKKVLKVSVKSIFLNIGVAIVFGITGFIYGALFLKAENLNWYIPEQTKNVQDFVNVGSIHNFGYLGGVIGLIVGIYYQIKYSKKTVA